MKLPGICGLLLQTMPLGQGSKMSCQEIILSK